MHLESRMKDIIERRKRLHLNDDYGIQAAWAEMTNLLSEQEKNTITYLEKCSKSDLYWVSEIFEDVARNIRSQSFIDCLRILDKRYPDLEMRGDIDLAENYINQSLRRLKQSNLSYDWKTMYVGYKLHIIKEAEVTQYAVEFLSTHPNCENASIVELAWGEFDIDYERVLKCIVQELYGEEPIESSSLWEYEKRKWRFSILRDLDAEYKHFPQMLLHRIAEVYADFGYPEEMKRFIYYMLSKENTELLSSKEDHIVRLIRFFYEFLRKEQKDLDHI
jgi:hypothetical protein